ncbi:MAG: hypothetical protein GF401_07115 [Chitinivibrionales bacterium]|nr:hypothetical protein [Chitinivibrionales bacterium]
MQTKLFPILILLAISLNFCSSHKKENQRNDEASLQSTPQNKKIEIKNDKLCSTFFSEITASEESLSEEYKQTKRISTNEIENFLSEYHKGELVFDSSYGMNECTGEKIHKRCYSNNITEFGSFYNIYARQYDFWGEFQNILGMSKGMSKENIINILGTPFRQSENLMLYISEKPTDEDKELFDYRWALYIVIENGLAKGINLRPNLNDC